MARLRSLTVAVAAALLAHAAPFAHAGEAPPADSPAATADRAQVPGASLVRSLGRLIAQATSAGKPAAPAPVPAAAEAPPAPRFDITRFDVRGNTVLPQALIERTVAPFTGSRRDFGDVQRALESLQDAYARAGYGTVQVLLPEQALDQGVVVLQVNELKLGRVTVEGNRFFTEENIRRSLPALAEGTPPNSVAIARQARVANENPAKNVAVVLRAGASPDQVDATVRVTDEKLWRAAVTLDNTGSRTTGMHRLGFGYQYGNVDGRDEVFTLQYIMSPRSLSDWDDLKVIALGYRFPLYRLGDSLDLVAGYSSASTATVASQAPGGGAIGGLFNVTGSGTVFGARYNHNLARPRGIDDYEHRLTFGLDYKAFSTNVVQQGVPGSLVPDVTVYPLSATYTASRRTQESETAFYLSYVKQFFRGGADTGAEKFNDPSSLIRATRNPGRPNYDILRFGVNFAHALPSDMQMRLAFSGQYTDTALIPGEQFGLGGVESVRGLYERVASHDRGMRASFELYSPDYGNRLDVAGLRLRMLVFSDWATGNDNHATAASCVAVCAQSAMSVGFGMRLSTQQGINYRFDYGRLRDAAGTQNRRDERWHFALAVPF